MTNIVILIVLFTGLGLPLYSLISMQRKNWQKIFGESFFLGIFLVITLLNVFQYLNIDLNISIVFNVLLIFSILCFFILGYLKRKTFSLSFFKEFNYSDKKHIYLYLTIFIVITHLYHIILQNTSMPLIGWDAWNGWVAKAKIWYYHGLNEPLINRFVWLQSDSALTNPIVHYPDGLSLLYLFQSGFWGWNETQLNAVYPAMLIAFVLGFYGNIKLLTSSSKYACLAVIMLVTIPILNIHMVLAGYADIWISAYLVLCVFNAQFFLNKPNIKLFFLILIYCICLVMFKLESWVWLIIFISAFFLALLSVKKRIILYTLFISVCSIWWIFDGFSINSPIGELIIKPELIQIPLLGSYALTFLNTSDALLEALFYSNSWGLLWYLIPVVLILPIKISDKSALVLPSLFLIFTLFFLFVLFFMTYASNFANDFTSSNRIVLHIVPVYIYFLIQVFNQYISQKSTK